ncbi:lysoplasmalogenase [Caldalkalibacillus mannanilyticus]|uniref:lysoplasmalogenase n=1 Tax=Caldalkalibacillus mannanilyticus TaxID=1418 RepID=UPI00046A9B44|nr:lysoplasmalogenase [Caldalkalibacillus mannanilyticus]
MLFTLLAGCVLLSAVGYLSVIWKKHRGLKYLLKPLTMVFIILIALFHAQDAFGLWILIGLLFSVLGDIFLMLPKDRFIQGLISFFFAHVSYILAFLTMGAHQELSLPSTILLIALAIGFFLLIASGVRRSSGRVMLVAVFFYITVITTMTLLGLATGSPVLMAAVLFFYISDAILALNRFLYSFASSDYLIMITYYSAQFLFAYSLV